MKVIIKNPNSLPELKEWPEITNERIQEVVGGWYCIAMAGPNWTALCHDEGLLLGLPYNFNRVTDNAPIVGPVVFVGEHTDEHGERDFCGLPQAAVAQIMNGFIEVIIHDIDLGDGEERDWQ